MQIVLIEEVEGASPSGEKIFAANEIVTIGRDAGACRVVFTAEKFPSVSRRHAEIRFSNGAFFLIDTGSTYGTFVNGQRIAAPFPLQNGSLLQFGTDGARLRVKRIEQAAAPQFPVSAPPISKPSILPNSIPLPSASSTASFSPASKPLVPSAATPSNSAPNKAFLQFADPQKSFFYIEKDLTEFGRDASCDVAFPPNATMISRRHASLKRAENAYLLSDNGSFNGTLVNGQRIAAPTFLRDGDQVQIGEEKMVFRAPQTSAPSVESAQPHDTLIFKLDAVGIQRSANTAANAPLITADVRGKNEIFIGRDASCDISLDGLQISSRHARISVAADGVWLEDLGSTNGTFLESARIKRERFAAGQTAFIGSYALKIDQNFIVNVFDTRSNTRLDGVNLVKVVANRRDGSELRLLDDVSIAIAPNEFVGLLGTSGAGKSTLMNALAGVEAPTGGTVFFNRANLFANLDALKQFVGYVPQEDVLHRELSVYRTLYYTAKLRLSDDVSEAEIGKIIDEVIDVTGLNERREVAVGDLSGGQRKRVAVAVELITKPSVIFLDEPTSGLDPANEQRIMNLFRQIAASGRTVILTTHAMENVNLFDKIAVMLRGKLVFYGTPDETRKFFGKDDIRDIFSDFDARNTSENTKTAGEDIEQTALRWRENFYQHENYQKNIITPFKDLDTQTNSADLKTSKRKTAGFMRQFATLTKRYAEIFRRDKTNLFILFGQAPLIALLTFLAVGRDATRDFLFFLCALLPVWFGTSVAAREIVRERGIFRRERMVNLGIAPYISSKILVLLAVVLLQCALYFIPLKLLSVIGLLKMPGAFFGVPQLLAMFAAGAVGIALGLFISAKVKTSEAATSLVPLILIPQILFSGLLGVPHGVSRFVGLAMPTTWAFESVKRFSGLDTLREEGAKLRGATGGAGLYKFVEKENENLVAQARADYEKYGEEMKEKMHVYQRAGRNHLQNVSKGIPSTEPTPPEFGSAPSISEAKKIPNDLSDYVEFQHSWINVLTAQIALAVMFGFLILLTMRSLKRSDREKM